MAYQFTQTGAEIQDILDLAQLQIAAPYDSASSYTAGDYCTKDDGFYVCTASTSGTWDGSKWSAVTVGDVLETANANISSLNATLTNINSGFGQNTAPASVSVPSGIWTTIWTKQFDVGLWFIEYGATFNSNSTGYRCIGLGADGSSFNPGRDCVRANAIANNYSQIGWSRIVNITTPITMAVWAFQNSGSAIDTGAIVRYVRLR